MNFKNLISLILKWVDLSLLMFSHINKLSKIQGKFKARFEILTEKEAEHNPAGLGRNEPQGLTKPKYVKNH